MFYVLVCNLLNKVCMILTKTRICESLMPDLSKKAVFYRSILIVMLIGLCVSGCSYPSARLHPQFSSFRQPMRVMMVMVPEIRILEQMPDGSRLFNEEKSQQAQQEAQTAIIRELNARHFTVRSADADMMQQRQYSAVTALFRSVNRSIQLHTYGPQIFPEKTAAFEYNLGSVADLLDANGADGLVVAIGHQTDSKKHTENWLSLAVVEPEGRIIWYGLQSNPQQANPQRKKGMSALVANIMDKFWEQGS